MTLGRYARSAIEALRDATQNTDARVRKAAEIALAFIETCEPAYWLL
jgi:hypothetical protein